MLIDIQYIIHGGKAKNSSSGTAYMYNFGTPPPPFTSLVYLKGSHVILLNIYFSCFILETQIWREVPSLHTPGIYFHSAVISSPRISPFHYLFSLFPPFFLISTSCNARLHYHLSVIYYFDRDISVEVRTFSFWRTSIRFQQQIKKFK